MSLEKVGDILRTGSPPTTPSPPITVPECWACMDTGQTGGGPGNRYCDCELGQSRQRTEWLRSSGVPTARQNETLAAFTSRPGTAEALAAAQEAASAGTLRWLLLYGGVGNGKTHLANGIAMASIEAGKRARVVNSLVLLSDLRAVSGTPAQSLHLRELATIPLLVVDDLIWATDLEARWLEEVLQRRYMDKRPLVATTNRDLKELPAPLVSRFWELGRAVLNKGGDYRRGVRL